MPKTRAIEMYIGEKFGTWDTVYVNIPIDTPESDIERVGREEVKRQGYVNVFSGVYSIPPSNDQPLIINLKTKHHDNN